mmetsp:Transcript_118155/g.338958  ORF Transcript_118155/g.338958 Transcript_118155/m.338958 type:complete len:491 (+) Transcript_118155:70-1542(+)
MGAELSVLDCCGRGGRNSHVAPLPMDDGSDEYRAFPNKQEAVYREEPQGCCGNCGYGVATCFLCSCCGLCALLLWMFSFVWFLESVPGLLPSILLPPIQPEDLGKRVCKESTWTPKTPDACGARAWISQKALDQVCQDVHEVFEKRMIRVVDEMVDNATHRDPISFVFGALKVSSPRIDVQRLSIGALKGAFVEGRGLAVNIEDVEMSVRVHYRVDSPIVWHPMAGSGQATLVSGKGTSMKLLVGFGVDKGLPKLRLREQDFDFGLNITTNNTWDANGLLSGFMHQVTTWAFTEFTKLGHNVLEQVMGEVVAGFINSDAPLLLAGPALLLPVSDKRSNCLALDLTLCNIQTKKDVCRTIVGSRCVTPFKYKEQTYDRCTGVDSTTGATWCPTKLDASGNYIDGEWGYCNPICSGINGLVEHLESAANAKIREEITKSIALDSPPPAEDLTGGLVSFHNADIEFAEDVALFWTSFDLHLSEYIGKMFPKAQ